MSELITFVFRDPFRAPEVLNELRRREWAWVGDLEDAVAVTINSNGRARIHLSVDPSTFEAARWARLWGSLLKKTLFFPLADVLAEAVDGFATSMAWPERKVEKFGQSKEAQWWQDTLEPSVDFRRDVAALILPGRSAIFMLLRDTEGPKALEQLRNYGDTILHTTVSKEQESKMLAMLAS